MGFKVSASVYFKKGVTYIYSLIKLILFLNTLHGAQLIDKYCSCAREVHLSSVTTNSSHYERLM